MTISEGMRKLRLPNPTTPEDLECRWSKTLRFGEKVVIVAKNHGLSLSSICCRIPLITPGTRGNIHTAEGGDFVGKDD